MSNTQEQLRLMSAAIIEMRALLAHGLGSDSTEPRYVRLASHLAYALHDDALTVLEGNGNFDCEKSKRRIMRAERIVGERLSDGFNELRTQR